MTIDRGSFIFKNREYLGIKGKGKIITFFNFLNSY